jgi:hypothetical protein
MSDTDIVGASDSNEPLKLSASFSAGSNYSGAVRRISWKKPQKDRRPIVLVVAGCAFSAAEAEFAKDAIRLSVEYGITGLAGSKVEACQSRNAAAINAAVAREIDFMMRNMEAVEIGDLNRVLLYGSGEAVPAVMAYGGSFTGRMLLGGPCFTSWPSTIASQDPMILVWPSKGAGAGWSQQEIDFKSRDLEGSDPVVLRRLETVGQTLRASCQPRLPAGLPSNVEVVRSAGELGWMDRSPELLADERAAYQALMS